MGSFEGKVIAINHAASGIGLATAQLLAAQGALLSLADDVDWLLEDTLPLLDHPERHLVIEDFDIRGRENVDFWIQETVRHFGKLDGAVNVTQANPMSIPLSETTDSLWGELFDDNAYEVFYCMRAELRMMGAGASIVSVPSTHGQSQLSGNAAHAAHRGFSIALTKAAAKENPSIRVNCVSAGSVDTSIDASNKQNVDELRRTVKERQGRPIDVANVIAFLLSDAASFVTGAVYDVKGGQGC